MKPLTILIAALAIHCLLQAQHSENYADVAVIINDNSATSVEIGNYFQQQRNLPAQNVIHITAPTSETIDSAQFEDIRQQIENHLVNSGTADSINFLVTTKGVPLLVERADCEDLHEFLRCSSLDSELALLLGDFQSDIGKDGVIGNPYAWASEKFSREEYGIYLVTRLDGYSKDDVLDLIDRSGPGLTVNKHTGQFVFDISHVSDPQSVDMLGDMMEFMMDSLENRGWNTTFHPDTQLLTGQENVVGFAGVVNGSVAGNLNYSWTNGAISYFMSFSAATFDPAQNTDNELLTADLIADGASGALGYTSFAFASYLMLVNHTFNSYIDENTNYTLAESYYQGIGELSGHTVVLGDPKTSVKVDSTTDVNDPEIATTIKILPNPSNGTFQLESGPIILRSARIYNQLGQLVHRQEFDQHQRHTIHLPGLASGTYLIRIESEDDVATKKLLIAD